MKKTILITGSTDGIGLATAKSLAQLGHNVLLHGRSEAKLAVAKEDLSAIYKHSDIETYSADLSKMADVKALAQAVKSSHQQLDVLINNAGVFKVANTVSADNLDIRFAVNTIAPYLLTQNLLPLFGPDGRIVNLSSAAQTPVEPTDLTRVSQYDDGQVYAQSKLALTMWSRQLASTLGNDAPAIIAVNPASFLGSKMVKEAYGRQGGDLQIGADILVKAALSEEFANASGLYFDNDAGRFTDPHPAALNSDRCQQIIDVIKDIIASLLSR